VATVGKIRSGLADFFCQMQARCPVDRIGCVPKSEVPRSSIALATGTAPNRVWRGQGREAALKSLGKGRPPGRANESMTAG
jgi:hypothetical protein